MRFLSYWSFKGAKDAADKLSVDLETNGPDAESNVSQQVEQLAAAVNQHPDAIALAASQPDAVQDALVNAKSQSIPVIGFDSGVPGDASGAVVATATTDNVAAGGNVATNLAANEAFKAAVGAGTTSAPAVIGVWPRTRPRAPSSRGSTASSTPSSRHSHLPQ